MSFWLSLLPGLSSSINDLEAVLVSWVAFRRTQTMPALMTIRWLDAELPAMLRVFPKTITLDLQLTDIPASRTVREGGRT